MLRQRPATYFAFTASLLLYIFIAYGTQRHDSIQLLSAYGILFSIYGWIIFRSDETERVFWVYTSLLLRASLLFALPNLSDDFYRFVWDGRLLANGYHPFAEVPSYYINNNIAIPGITEELYAHLNSKDYFTIYPPLTQFTFWLSAKLSPESVYGSVVIMKIIMLAAEAGTLFLMIRLLEHFVLPAKNVLLYALNPLVILELTGNLHFEGLLIFFLLLSLYWFTKEQVGRASLSFSLAITVKLLPLMFLPVVLARFSRKKTFLFYLFVALCTALLFVPLYDQEIIEGFRESLGYYFRKFEFNASLYYLIREWGYWYYGYNIIQTVGWKLGAVATILILLYSFRDFIPGQNKTTLPHPLVKIPTDWMWILLIYFLFVSTLHPWYITTLLACAVFNRFRFIVIWTGLIFLTYSGYSAQGFRENLWITTFEYIVVLGYLAFECYERKIRQGKEAADHFLSQP